VLISVVLAVVYWATNDFVESYFHSRLENKYIELVEIENSKGIDALIQNIENETRIVSDDTYHYYLTDPKGRKLAGNLFNWPVLLKINGQVQKLKHESSFYPEFIVDEDEEGGFWLMSADILADGNKLLVARYIDYTHEIKEFIVFLMFMIIPLSGLLAITLGLMLGRTILKKIDHINATASTIASGDFNNRVHDSGKNDEFDELASHLNIMLDRIQKLVEGMRRVTDNIAHDLRSPLSRLRNHLEITILQNRNEAEYVESIKLAMDDADQLIQTFNALLEIAQTEAGNYRGEWNNVNLSILSTDIGMLYQNIAEDNTIAFDMQIDPEIVIQGNRHLLSQAISNLLENALKYTSKGGYIKFTLSYKDNNYYLSLSDNGPGIPADKRDFVLERFSRLDDSRYTAGNGLGLSLVKAVTDLHHATLNLSDNNPGLKVEITFTRMI
tara:strand:- start:11855 stop:13180 length:1326 start_codon:yes stop_codon:yes gene_type:complete